MLGVKYCIIVVISGHFLFSICCVMMKDGVTRNTYVYIIWVKGVCGYWYLSVFSGECWS